MDDNDFKNNVFKDIWEFMTNRLLLVAVIIAAGFYFLAANLFDIQIINNERYIKAISATFQRSLVVTPARGTIYDKFGRPLAINNSAYSIKIDPSTTSKNSSAINANDMLYELIKLFERNGQKYIDDFPISLHEPYEFEGGEGSWKERMTVPADATAYEAIEYLRELFNIDPEMSNLEARKLLALRGSLYLQRFTQYNTITIAYDVNTATMVELEERSREFPGVFVDVETLREYPAGQFVSHIIGYIGRISEADYKANEDKGYSPTSMFGRTGIERSFETELRGVNGTNNIETNALGVVVRSLEVTPPVQGNKVFLTIDSKFQEKLYYMLEDHLRDALKSKLQGRSARERAITVQELFISMVNANNISIKDILDSKTDSDSYEVCQYILSADPDASVSQKDEKERNAAIKNVKEIIAEGINSRKIRPASMLLVMFEQGIITGDEDYITRVRLGRLAPLQVVLEKLDEKEITPQMTNLDPSTGSVVLLDIDTGAVIAAVGYPTFDNNELVNNFNNDYYTKISKDPTSPLRNRPFMEARAPGSTFKMLSMIAGLEGGSVTPTSTIYDELTFTKAGRPYTRCHSGYSHGNINVVSALAVSCNYFFCETVFRLGGTKSGNTGINLLNQYMADFGLNLRTGVEIGEWADEIRGSMARNGWPDNTPIISSPLYKEFTMKMYNPEVEASEYSWFDGDTVKTSIGQANNAYPAVTMAKYIATLATGGVRYQTHLLDRVTTQQGELVREFKPVVEKRVDVSPETMDTVYKAMLAVTEGSNGTASSVFRNFPVRVAGKTGTAQESSVRNDHSSFGGFAPFDDPQIAIYVSLPYGDTPAFPNAAANLAKKVIAEYMGLNLEPEYPEETNRLAR